MAGCQQAGSKEEDEELVRTLSSGEMEFHLDESSDRSARMEKSRLSALHALDL